MYVKEKKRKNIANAALQTDSRPEDGTIQSRILSMPLVCTENRSTVQIFQHTGSFNGRIQTIHIQWQNI